MFALCVFHEGFVELTQGHEDLENLCFALTMTDEILASC